jgi:invasion protein IalB
MIRMAPMSLATRYLAWLVVLGALPLLLCGAPARSEQLINQHGEWWLKCRDTKANQPGDCALVQSVQSATDRQRFASAVLTQSKERAFQLKLIVPLGVELVPGVHLTVDGAHEATAALTKCDNSGCIGEVAFDEDLRKRFEIGKSASVVVKTSLDEGYSLPISLARFDDAFRSLLAAVGMRSELRIATIEAGDAARWYTIVAESDTGGFSCGRDLVKTVKMQQGDEGLQAQDLKEVIDFSQQCAAGSFVIFYAGHGMASDASKPGFMKDIGVLTADRQLLTKQLSGVADTSNWKIKLRDPSVERDVIYPAPETATAAR